MPKEPMFEKAIAMPLGYVFTARARPSSVRRTLVRLLPWALYAMLPPGRRARMTLAFARRFSPFIKQKGQ